MKNALKKLMAIFMSVCFVFPVFSNMKVLGETGSGDIIIEGIWKRENPFTLYSNGDLVISGEGDIKGRNSGDDVDVIDPDYDDIPMPEPIVSWDGYEDYIKRVVIEEGITGIGYQVFYNLTNVTEIQLPDTLVQIEFNAFENNSSLTFLKIPKSMKYIFLDAFKNCSSLSEVYISSKNVELIGNVFNGCSDELVIKGYRNSSAQKYAGECGLRFEAADADVPTASVQSSEFSEPFSLELYSDIENAVIYYTTNGDAPDHNSSIYTGPIYIDKTMSINAIVTADGYFDSDAACFVYLYVDPSIGVPGVVTNAAEDITYNSAVFSGEITDNGGAAVEDMYFVYWNKYSADVKYTVKAEADFSARITNLASDSEYYYYAAATNAYGTGEGAAVSFRTLTEKKPQSISVSPSHLNIENGGQYQLTAEVLPHDADNRNVIWSSSDTDVAQVDKSGRITAVGEGSAVITAVTEINRLKAYCAVTVSDAENEIITDFSEWNMATNTSSYAVDGWDNIDRAISGGHYNVATAYLARWDGAVKEENDPYPIYDGNAAGKYHEVDADYIVSDVVWIQGRNAPDDNDKLKRAVMKYGALYASYKNLSRCWDASRTNYYYGYERQGDTVGGHAVAIVGWDDDYPASNFVDTPPGNGAFICKNSWGENRGEKGYFYVSYYDMYFGHSTCAAFLASDSTDEYNKIYQYDPYGTSGTMSFENSNSIYGANVYPEAGTSMQNDETLKAVSFYTYFESTNYEVYVVTDYKDKSSLLRLGEVLASGSIDEMGYHTVLLDRPIELKKGTRFAVVIKLSSPNVQTQYMYMESPYGGSRASANKDESYVSCSPNEYWHDVTETAKNSNLCIKAFTDTGSASYSNIRYAGTEINMSSDQDENIVTLAGEYEDLDMSWSGVTFENITTGGDNTALESGIILPRKYDMREEGLVTAVRDQGQWGTCWAHASYASLESSILKQALQAQSALEEINIDKDSIEMAKGSDTYLSIYNYQSDKIKWSSSNESVALVDTNGRVTAVSNGEAVIFAETSNGKHRAQCAVRVDDGSAVSYVELADDEVAKSVGDVFIVDYGVYPLNSIDKTVTWKSSNPQIAEVNENGVITALSLGTAVITATSSNGKYSDSILVHVNGDMMCEITNIESNMEQKADGIAGKVTASIKNKSNIKLSPMIILALYDGDGAMSGVKYVEADLNEGINSVTFDDIYAENLDIDQVTMKVFVWDSLKFIQPIADCLSTSK